jgi:hypothetical protein
VPADDDKLREIHAQKGRRLNDSELPNLFAAPVRLTLVGEDEHGEIVYGAYVENVAHIRAIGVHRNGLRSLLGLRSVFVAFLRSAGYRLCKINFKRQMTAAVRGPLIEAGFRPEDKQGPNFTFRL